MEGTHALDPFSTLVRLALLNFMNDGVKIGIGNNSIHYFEDTWMDWARRTVLSISSSGYSRETMYKLRIPMQRAVMWFGDACPELFALAIDGLIKLKTNYRDTACSTCGNVIETINFTIQNIKTKSVIPDFEMTPVLQDLKNCWSTKDIDAVKLLFSFLKSDTGNSQAVFIKCIQDFIFQKEQTLVTLLRML
jgi:hypothetical protein